MEVLHLLNRLNDETRCHHGDADGDVDMYLFRAGVSVADYRTYLTRVYGFLVPVELAFETTAGLGDIIDLRVRAKGAALVRDLMALGMTMTEINELPQSKYVQPFRSVAAALGWMYVVERPLLSAAVIRGHLATFLGSNFALAGAYLGCYQGQVGTLWRELGLAMDRLAVEPGAADRIVMSAHEAFRALSRWRIQQTEMAAAFKAAG